jgi:tetratricopeptide (TPR) repeat protein
MLVVQFALSGDTGSFEALARALNRECGVNLTLMSSFSTLSAGDSIPTREPICVLLEGEEKALRCAFDWLHRLNAGDTVLVSNDVAVHMLFEQALMFRRYKNEQRVLEILDLALRIEPEQGPLWSNRANALAALGDLAEATRSYQRALELAPSDALIHQNFGAHLLSLGELRQARDEFGAAVALDPSLDQSQRAIAALDQRLSSKPADLSKA